jgi:hypothetical protein
MLVGIMQHADRTDERNTSSSQRQRGALDLIHVPQRTTRYTVWLKTILAPQEALQSIWDGTPTEDGHGVLVNTKQRHRTHVAQRTLRSPLCAHALLARAAKDTVTTWHVHEGWVAMMHVLETHGAHGHVCKEGAVGVHRDHEGTCQ